MWTARVAWAVLPFTSGAAVGDALGEWSRRPAVVAAALLWTAWGAGLVALLAPRPWAFTLLRVAATTAVVTAAGSSFGRDAPVAALAVSGSLAATAAACSARVAHACANASAYGNERRFPLRAPTPVAAILVAPAAALVAAGIACGPLLVASGTVIGGIGLGAAGLFVAAFLSRSLHGLSRRWVVLVPAGLVIADPLTLVDPVLLPYDKIRSVIRLSVSQAPAGALDLRLGTLFGSVEVQLRDPATIAQRRRNDAEIVTPSSLLVAPLRPAALLDAVDQAATPPPSRRSPS